VGTFLRSKSGRELRRLVSNQCRIIEIVEFDDRNIYPDAVTHLILLTAWKTDERSCSRYVFVKDARRRPHKMTARCRQASRKRDVLIRPFPSCALTDDEWWFDPPACRELLRQMEAVGVPLAVLPATISLGVYTGADDVFILRHVSDRKSGLVIARRRKSGQEIALEKGATRPILRGRGIAAYGKIRPRFVCVFPYDRAGAILDQGSFVRRYPRTYKYLASQRSELLKRSRSRHRPWYALRTAHVTRAMAAPKLIASVIGRPGSFAFDREGVLCHSSVLTITVDPKTIRPHFLLGVLNSRPMRFYIGHRTLPMRGDRCAHRLEAVRQIPIPVPGMQPRSDLCAAVIRYAQILVAQNISPSQRSALLRKIDRLAMRLYGLSRRDFLHLPEAQTMAC